MLDRRKLIYFSLKAKKKSTEKTSKPTYPQSFLSSKRKKKGKMRGREFSRGRMGNIEIIGFNMLIQNDKLITYYFEIKLLLLIK